MPYYPELYHTEPFPAGQFTLAVLGHTLMREAASRLGKKGETEGRSRLRSPAEAPQLPPCHGGKVAPGSGVGTQGIGDRKVQRTGELVFRLGEIFPPVCRDATVKMGLPGGQVADGRECRAGRKHIIGEGGIPVAGHFLSARPVEKSSGVSGIGFDGPVQNGDGASGIA